MSSEHVQFGPPSNETPDHLGSAADTRSTTDHHRPLILKMPVDVRSIGISIMATATVILLLRYAQEVIIPFVLSTLIFYALDPIVDRLERWRIPRVVAAAVVLLTLIGAIAGTGYSLSDEAMQVVEELPEGAQKLRQSLERSRNTTAVDAGAIEKVQEAAQEIDKAAAAVATPAPAPEGVVRVQVEEPTFRASDYVWWGSMGILTLASQAILICFLTYFLLVANDLFKRKLIRYPETLSKRKITVQILDEVGAQIERFMLVQAVTSVIVAVATGLALWWIGLEQPAVWGLAAGVFNSIPYFGPLIVTGGLATVAFLQFETFAMTASVAGVALLITTLEGWLLTPTLLGRVAGMNPVAIFAGLLFWSWVWGVWGLLLAVPMMMVIKAVSDHIEDLRPIGDFLGE